MNSFVWNTVQRTIMIPDLIAMKTPIPIYDKIFLFLSMLWDLSEIK